MQPALFGKRVNGERREGEARGEVCGCARTRRGGNWWVARGVWPNSLTDSRCQRYCETAVIKLFL